MISLLRRGDKKVPGPSQAGRLSAVPTLGGPREKIDGPVVVHRRRDADVSAPRERGPRAARR